MIDSDWVGGINAIEGGKASAVVSEIFCKNRFTSQLLFLGCIRDMHWI